jgi:hypothetical protein
MASSSPLPDHDRLRQSDAMRYALTLTALVALTACQMDRLPAPDPLPPEIACMPDQSLVGQPDSVLAAMTFPQGTRIFRSGDALTADYSASRLNIEIGVDDTIIRVSCG